MFDKSETKPPVPWGLIAVILVLAGIGAYVVRNVLSDDSPLEKSHVPAVTLVKPTLNPSWKPPPSVRVKEKLAGLERVQKEAESSSQVMQVEGQALRNAGTQEGRPSGDTRGGAGGDSSGTPAGDILGVDAEGGAGGDSFGLVARKGGRSILARAGGGGGGLVGGSKGVGKVPLLSKFAGYITIVTAEIKEKVIKRLDEEGGIPHGKLQCIIRVRLDKAGKIIDHRIIGSSGNTRMDRAVISALPSCRFSEPPPEDMPSTMDIMITSQG